MGVDHRGEGAIKANGRGALLYPRDKEAGGSFPGHILALADSEDDASGCSPVAAVALRNQ